MISLPASAPPGPVLAHADARRTLPLVRDRGSRTAMLAGHLEYLVALADGRLLSVPTFNYDYCVDGRHDVRETPSQVGPITEAFRTDLATWRSEVPVFSFAGVGEGAPPDAVQEGEEVDPFDERSWFGRVVADDGVIVWYGAPLASTTLIHHVEHLAGRPPYRYDKWFPGVVTTASGEERSTRLRYHVRPRGRALDYDFARIEDDLVSAGIVRTVDEEAGVRWAPAADLAARWREQLEADPLALLDEASRAWVAPELERLGRRFEQADFEEVDR